MSEGNTKPEQPGSEDAFAGLVSGRLGHREFVKRAAAVRLSGAAFGAPVDRSRARNTTGREG